jgi:hypothetical protein
MSGAALILKNANFKIRWSVLGLVLSLGLGLGLGLAGCSEVSAQSPAHNFKVKARQVRNEIKVIRPGELARFLEKSQDEKLRYVVYRSLEAQRDRLRGGRTTWSLLDLVALTEVSKKDMAGATYQPLRAVAEGHFIWATLEGLEPGKLATMLDGPYADEVVAWIGDFKALGRPNIEGKLNRHDYFALQRYAMSQRPVSRALLRWTFEQDRRAGQVAGFLGRDWSEAQLKEVMRVWCSSEGWTPLAHAGELTPREKNAVKVSFERLAKSQDPLTRRESKRWSEWFAKQSQKLTAAR